MFASGPAVLIAGIALSVFGICDAAFGWSDSAKTRGRIICLSDMTEATSVFVNKYYLRDDAKQQTLGTYHIFGRHLENLANLRITGESRFIQLHGDNTPESKTALQNADKVKTIAAKMGLFVH
jgi:hypothetical protein